MTFNTRLYCLLCVQWSAGLARRHLTALQVTELMYHPADADTSQGERNVDGDEFEFIEITNTGGTTLDLSEVSFAQGVFFDFSTLQSAQIQSGESMILVKNRQAYESRYGTGLSSLKLTNRSV